ncbi:hypothetical protein ACNOYE_14395 [Nannocystaceae bacterium ST9]
MTLRSALVALALASACTSTSDSEAEVDPESGRRSEPPLVVEPPPEPSGERRELGPLLGGEVLVHAPMPARWASRMDFDQHRFITTEHTIESAVEGSAVLRLHDEGRAEACFATHESSASAMGRYQARDGKDHHDSSEHARVVGMTGSWQLEGEGPEITVRFDRTSWRTCEVDPSTEPFEQPALRCFAFAANAKVPSDALLCQVPEALHGPVELALLIGDSPRAGAWVHRRDPARGGVEPPTDAQPWLLLGAEPGLELRAEDRDRDAMPLVIRVAEVGDPVALQEP